MAELLIHCRLRRVYLSGIYLININHYYSTSATTPSWRVGVGGSVNFVSGVYIHDFYFFNETIIYSTLGLRLNRFRGRVLGCPSLSDPPNDLNVLNVNHWSTILSATTAADYQHSSWRWPYDEATSFDRSSGSISSWIEYVLAKILVSFYDMIHLTLVSLRT